MNSQKPASFRLSPRLRLFFVLVVFLLAAASVSSASCPTPPPTGSVTWTTPWCDEFNGALNSPIDATKWTFDTGNSGFGNSELETYCDPSSNTAPCNSATPNAYIDGVGHLAIKVLSPAANTWTSARLKTQGLMTFNAGRIEASIQIPSHAGLWPAFWNLGSQSGVSWPTVGESDILENWPTTSNIPGPGATGNRSTIHTTVTAGSGMGQSLTLPGGGRVDDLGGHIYGQIWSANMIQYYVDDPTQPFFVVTASDLPAGDTWPFSSPNNPFFLIMNMAVGGTLGAPTDSATGSQAPMLVDYVRQYVPSAVPVPVLTQPTAISVKSGATSGNTSTLNMTGTLGSGRVTFSCTTTAPKASCVVTSTDAVNPHTVDFTGSTTSATATVTATTTTYVKGYAADAGIGGTSGLRSWGGLAGGIVMLWLLSRVARNARKLKMGIGLLTIAMVIFLQPACGGSYGGGGGGGGGGGSGTPPGSYTITVNAYTISSTDAAVPAANTTFPLTVN
jgi:beta-glucanase (GH16 family)